MSMMSQLPAMRLYWSSRSPFVRKTMIAAHETGISARIETIRVEVDISTLVLEIGEVLFDSRVICEYFDSLTAGPRLFPSDPAERWVALRRDAIGSGIMENGVARIGENARPGELQSQSHLAAYKAKIEAALDYLEADASALTRDHFNIGHLAIGCALGYLDFRYADDDWRRGHSGLAEWHKGFAERASVEQTAHANVY